jgi:hypothetical protein
MPLEKTQENILTCQICKRKFNNRISIGNHIIKTHHLNPQQYYDIYYKQENEGNCKICNNKTLYNSRFFRYSFYCSAKCTINPETKIKKDMTCMKKYNNTNPHQSKIVKEKIKNTNINKYGCINPFQNEKIKQKIKETNLKKYGYEYPISNNLIREKFKNTCNEKYGVDYPSQNKIIRQKTMDTWMIKYGVVHNMQNKESQQKNRENAHKTKPYILPSGKIIHKQGYEPQFLDYIFQNNILKEDEIDYHPDGIKYVGKDYELHYYFPDFYIPKWNLIIETKSTWTQQLDINVNLKETATR